MNNSQILHQVKLIDGTFTPSEAKDVINTLIKEKINFHKIHRLSMSEGNVNTDTSFDDGRVNELLRAKGDFGNVYAEAKANGKKLRITGTLDIEMID